MPLQATSGAASYDAFGGGVAVVPKYIEDYFSAFLYQGTGADQTITTNIDLSTKGGLVWIKDRTSAYGTQVYDTVRGAGLRLGTYGTFAQQAYTTNGLNAFTTSGFSLGSDSTNIGVNRSGDNFVSWSWAKAPKFFDVVTYTGNGGTPQNISHSLGSVPGFIIVKPTSITGGWICYHRSLTASGFNPAPYNTINLNSTGSILEDTGAWNSTAPTSTVFTIGSSPDVNTNGATYVAYLFAHNAGGFGLTGTDNVISCGSFTTDGSGNATVTLGYEPQWVLVKGTGSGYGWSIFDNMRGMPVTGNSMELLANSSSAEGGIGSSYFNPTATGFYMGGFSASQTYIYIAIRRGPMKVPTSGTDVFLPKTRTGNGTAGTVVTGASWPMDALWISRRTGGGAGVGGFTDIDRLRGAYLSGANPLLRQSQIDAESTTYTTPGFVGGQTSYDLPSGAGYGLFNTSGVTYIDYLFRRSPSVFDEVCYTGTGSANTAFTHNLTVTPELMIVKPRSAATAPNWRVWSPINSTDFNLLQLSTNGAASSSLYSSSNVFPAIPTATTFTVGGSGSIQLNESGQTFVAYLFATCAGVSKVGSFTGNGSSQTINCGFTGGARFVMIKATSTTGDWMVADSARGIVSGSDPYLELNNTNAEVTGEDWLDTDSTGFVVNEVSGSNANTNGVTYIFLAIA